MKIYKSKTYQYRIRECIKNNGSKLYDIEYNFKGFDSLIHRWNSLYVKDNLFFATLEECVLAIKEKIEQDNEDYKHQIKISRYI